MGRREEKKRETRERLRDAAYALFERRGYQRTKVEDVARAAGVAPRTVYRYFPRKSDLVFYDVTTYIEETAAAIARRPAEEPPYDMLQRALLDLAPVLDVPANAERAQLVADDSTLYVQSLELRDAWGAAMGEALVARSPDGATPSDCRLLGHVAAEALWATFLAWRGPERETGRLPHLMTGIFASLGRLVRMSP